MLESIRDYCDSVESDTVFWCMGDETVLPLTMNWTESCKQLGIPMLYVALDLQSYHAMQCRVPTVHIPQGSHHVFVYKFIIGQQIMQQDKNWFYTDVDCVAQKDYTQTVQQHFALGADQLCQSVKQYAFVKCCVLPPSMTQKREKEQKCLFNGIKRNLVDKIAPR